MFLSEKPFESGWIQVWPAHADGERYVARDASNREISTDHIWRTRPVVPNQLAVGQLIILPSATSQDADGPFKRAYGPTESARAHELAMVVRVPDDTGMLIASNSSRVKADAVRLVEADARATVVVAGTPDRDCFTPDLRIVSPKQPYADLAVGFAAAVLEPATDAAEGAYLNFRDGITTRSRHAWKTRPATAADLRPGAVVFFTVVPRRTCDQLLTSNWNHTIVESATNPATGKVKLKGSAARAISELRVLAE
ncbi:MAG TPA: hypothetical protein VML75_05900 [Kofleriaceae bacterium]|nr:hypothetical protein [Kofleriaceae bacterium]